MSYLPHTSADRAHMLETVGVKSVEELLSDIPASLRLGRELELPESLTEYDLLQRLQEIASLNDTCEEACFLGAGAYNHFVPTIVETITSRSEFLTAYTPYQAEASQGTLQSIFEYQSLVCRLTGMDVANASVYDGGTAAVDAVLMALAQTRRNKVLVSRGVHPHTRTILGTYLVGTSAVIEELPLHDGMTVVPEIGNDVACVLIQIPNFLGLIEDGPAVVAAAHKAGAMAIVYVGDVVSLGVLKAPGSYGADLCCGDGQGIGMPLSFGGPYVGYLACRKALLRRIPGRLVGLTEDTEGRRGFCLTLQAREQHIRREKASSNICSNEGLCALAFTVCLSLLGPVGLRKEAVGSMQAAAELRRVLGEIEQLELVFNGPSFNEFVVRCPEGRADTLVHYLAEAGIMGGYVLDADYPELQDCLLLCCTELTSLSDIHALANEVRAFLEDVDAEDSEEVAE